MNANEDSNGDTVFDRLADGELSATERRELLATLDGREEGWRRCAMAFLEAQAWRQQFTQLVEEPGAPPVAPATSLQRPHAGPNAAKWFSLAAGLMVAFCVGWLIRAPGAAPSLEGVPRGQLAGSDRQETDSTDELLPGVESDADTVTLLVRDVAGNNQRLRVPLVDAADWDKQLGMPSSLPGDLRARFQQRGLDIQRRRRYAPMFFEQDKQLVPMVVPVEDTYVVPVKQTLY